MTAFGALRISRIIEINRLIAERSERYSVAAQWRADTRLNLKQQAADLADAVRAFRVGEETHAA